MRMKTAGVTKRIALAFTVVALAVAMVACQGAVGKTGPAGAAGDTGPAGSTGPTGPAGTTDNASPVASAIETMYLVVGGGAKPAAPTDTITPAAGNYGSITIDLNKYFTDAESPSLAFRAKTDNKKVATVSAAATTNVVSGTMLTVTAVGAGTAPATYAKATITVEAYDHVNAAVSSTFDVVVVASNNAPSVTAVDGIEDMTNTAEGNNKLYKSAGTVTRSFDATIDPGAIGMNKETLSFRTIVGDSKAGTAVVEVGKPVSTGAADSSGNKTYNVTVKALKPNVPADAAVTVMIFAKDNFGAEALVDMFDVVVNTPPKVGTELPNVTLYRGASGEAEADQVTGHVPEVTYELGTYFDFEFDSVGTSDVDEGDTVCTFSTSPRQPTGRAARAAVPTDTPPITALPADAVVAASMASVSSAAEVGTPLNSIPDGGTNTITVNSGATNAAMTGDFTLTITCEDGEASVSDSAQITVRP
jgi:hypothetical protein